ncbi:preprotein translocase subunit SecF [Candidatus Tenderia electrophaga]|jgi:preprotein translocase subunit SecF|uniref:Protein-export membrane protein SecF n=1 Tax=Candidatus Tenderia electrophaga TaxID=1748243 RepID=A0A0S2TBT2_9GAMM|nr:preprotein translocase subunit SecF [Candidatus Tenderia electrophaga]
MNNLAAQNTIDFMSRRNLALAFSAALLLVSIASLALRGLNLGIDFTGGTLVEVGYPDTADLTEVRAALEAGGFEGAVVQHFGTSQDVLIRLSPKVTEGSADISTRILTTLQGGGQTVDLRRVEFVGPQIGDELTEDGGLAMLAALFGVLIYVYFRFEIRFSLGAVIALIHDVVITMGIFSLFQFEFDLSVLAAVLAVIGYSLNDTIVVYDRVRENFRKMRKGTPLDIVNRSITQTLSRTLVTSLTTLLVLFALFVFGGEIIHGFSRALIIGVVVGTYSSIYVASSAVLMLGVSKADLMPVEKEGAELDNVP